MINWVLCMSISKYLKFKYLKSMFFMFRVVKPNSFSKKYPKVLQLPITNFCNSHCIICNLWKSKKREMSIKEFEEIKKAKPKKLYIAGDGPRNKIEKKKTDEVRKFVLDNIDWDCKVKTLFRKKNLGCGKAVSQAITWFFKNEEMGIILEDDCLPSQSFFPFCEELLKKYKTNNWVM